MRIQELLERQQYTVKNFPKKYGEITGRELSRRQMRNRFPYDVTGDIYGIPRNKEYIRVEHTPTLEENNPYYQYIKAIGNQMGVNPHYPVVISRKTQKDAETGNEKSVYRMEHLKDGISVPDKAIRKMFITLFTPKLSQGVDKSKIWKTMASYIEHAIQTNDFSNIKCEYLKQALSLIHRVIASNPQFELDMHGANIMARKNASGSYDLVIIDPIAGKMTDSSDF